VQYTISVVIRAGGLENALARILGMSSTVRILYVRYDAPLWRVYLEAGDNAELITSNAAYLPALEKLGLIESFE